jgi:hypothetical protein
VPSSIVDGMAKNEILQIVIFSLFFGIGAAAVGERANPLIDAIDGVAHVMLKVTGYVMNFAPIAVFAAVAGIIAKSGLGVLSTYGVFMAEFYLGIVLLWVVLIVASASCSSARASSPAARTARPDPAGLLDRLVRSGVPENPGRPGAFRRQEPHRRLRAADRLLVQSRRLDDVLHLRDHLHRPGLRHRDVAVDPDDDDAGADADLQRHGRRAARIAGGDRRDAGQFNIPGSGLLLLLGIDHFLDMARSATNVIGNGIATAVVAKWEGEPLGHRRPAQGGPGQWHLPQPDHVRRPSRSDHPQGRRRLLHDVLVVPLLSGPRDLAFDATW